MRLLNWPRRTGKTTYLVTWLEMTPHSVMVVHSESERDRILRENPQLEPERVLSLYSVLNGKLRGRERTTVAVDNLDLILPQLFNGCTVGPVTLTEGA